MNDLVYPDITSRELHLFNYSAEYAHAQQNTGSVFVLYCLVMSLTLFLNFYVPILSCMYSMYCMLCLLL